MSEKPSYEELEHVQSERDKALKALQESEERFSACFEATDVGMVFIDQCGTFLSVNQAASKLLGYSHNDLLDMSFVDIIHPEDIKSSIARFNKCLSDHVPYTLEKRYLTEDKRVTWVVATVSPVFDLDGKFLYAISHLQDITKRKIAEEALKQNECRYKQAQRIGQVGNWEYDLLTEKIWGSDGAKRIYEFDSAKNDFTINEVEQCIPDRKRVHQALVNLIEKGKTYDIEYEIHPITGPKKVIKSMAEVVINKSGIPIRIDGVIHDITASKKAEEKLQKSEETYRLLFENIMNGFALHEVVLNKNKEPIDFVFLEINSAFEQLTGLNKNDIIGKKVTEVLPGIEKDPGNWIIQYGDVALSGKVVRFEQYLESLDKWFSVLAFSSQYGQFATIFEDITVRKKTELSLRESEVKYRQLFTSIRDYILVADIDRNIIACNQPLEAGFGYKLEEILGKKTICLYASKDIFEEMGRELKKHIDDTHFTYTINYKKKSGAIFPGETSLFFLKNDKGETVGYIGIIRDITHRKRVEESLKKANDELKQKTVALEDTNTALEVLLKKRDQEKQKLEENLYANYELLIMPFLNKLKSTSLKNNQQNLIDIVETNLKEIVHPFIKKISNPMMSFTQSEIHIATMIKQGFTNKEIAQVLNCSKRTIDTHRENIRKKLDLTNQKINLKTFLLNL